MSNSTAGRNSEPDYGRRGEGGLSLLLARHLNLTS
jgi:hypothetical protein